MPEQKLRVGIITTTHGVRGDVKVFPTTDDIERFRNLKKVTVTDGRRTLETEVEHVKYVGNVPVLKLKGLDDMDAAALWRQADIYVDRADAVPLGENENYVGDVIGLRVVGDDGTEYGTVCDIMETGANDVYVVDRNGKELLLPSIPSCILEVNVEEGFVRVHMLPGLLDL